MRQVAIALASASLLSLTACGGGGGGGVESLGSVTPAKVDTGTLSPSPTPTSTTQSANLLDVTATTDYAILGGLQSIATDGKGGTLYRGDATLVTDAANKINYSPRDGIFTLTVADDKAGATRTVRYQDPAHRQAASLELEVPRLTGVNYLEALDGNALTTFFYQRPGTTGVQYVTLAGYSHTEIDADTGKRLSEHGAFVFGARTATLQVPISGAGSYKGDFLASMIGTKFDQGGGNPVFQWIVGSSAVAVDFAARTVGLTLNGSVMDAAVKNVAIDNATLNIPAGSTFAAAGDAKIDYLKSGGFSGAFSRAAFTVNGREIPVDFKSTNVATNVAGASSIDGTFYGPNAVNVGGSFRVTGGTPDQRVDIVGGFTGAK